MRMYLNSIRSKTLPPPATILQIHPPWRGGGKKKISKSIEIGFLCVWVKN